VRERNGFVVIHILIALLNLAIAIQLDGQDCGIDQARKPKDSFFLAPARSSESLTFTAQVRSLSLLDKLSTMVGVKDSLFRRWRNCRRYLSKYDIDAGFQYFVLRRWRDRCRYGVRLAVETPLSFRFYGALQG
jgi:hypothetical protein